MRTTFSQNNILQNLETSPVPKLLLFSMTNQFSTQEQGSICSVLPLNHEKTIRYSHLRTATPPRSSRESCLIQELLVYQQPGSHNQSLSSNWIRVSSLIPLLLVNTKFALEKARQSLLEPYKCPLP